jgi:hypothetical protein
MPPVEAPAATVRVGISTPPTSGPAEADSSLQIRIGRAIHLPHAADSDLSVDFIRAEAGARHGKWVRLLGDAVTRRKIAGDAAGISDQQRRFRKSLADKAGLIESSTQEGSN